MPVIEGAQRPFWMHQAVEYLLGLVLIGAAFQAVQPAVPAAMGVVVLANTAIARGPVSAFPMVGRRLHRWLDVAVMLALVAAAFQPVVDVDNTGRLLLCAIAFVHLFVWLNSDFSERADRRRDRAARRSAAVRPDSEELGRKAGRAVGSGVNAARRLGKKLKDQQ